MKVGKETLIRDIVQLGPSAIEVLMNFGMGCIGCPASQSESLSEAALAHGINVDNLLKKLNELS